MTVIPPRPDDLHPVGPSPEGDGPTWGVGEAILAYVGAFSLAAVASVPLFALVGTSDTSSMLANVVVALAIVGGLLWWLRLRHPGWRDAVGLRAASPLRDLVAGFVFGAVAYPVIAVVVASSLGLVLQRISGEAVRTPEQVPTDLPPIGIALVVVYAILVAPVAEEFFFRGVLFPAARARLGLWPGAFLSGLAFGLIHYVPAPWADAVLLMAVMVPTGVAFAWIRARRGSLYGSIGAHVAFNVIGLVLIYAAR